MAHHPKMGGGSRGAIGSTPIRRNDMIELVIQLGPFATFAALALAAAVLVPAGIAIIEWTE